MPSHIPSLAEACSQGALDPESWTESLINMVADPAASNRDLLCAVSKSRLGLDMDQSTEWMDNLLEFSLWETGVKPSRLGLCDYLLRSGLAQANSPRRWRSYGGLVHVACEAGSVEAIRWALEREPSSVARRGGRLGISIYHALCLHENESVLLEAIDLLSQYGADPGALSYDGRNALFRCSNLRAAIRLMELGASPWLADADGFTPFGFWLELGMWNCALAALSLQPKQANEFHSWGSMGGARGTRPKFDRPLFILTCSHGLRHGQYQSERSRAFDLFIEAGADPLLLDARGQTLFQRSGCPIVLSAMERHELHHIRGEASHSGQDGRL